MANGVNLASKYSKSIDERFYKESQAALAVSNDYEFTGVKTVNVYSVPTVPMKDYELSGTERYGEPEDLARCVQTLTISRDRAFTFVIDKGEKLQSMAAGDSGKALARQIREVIVPEYDAYVFRTLAQAATLNGNFSTEPLTAENAYENFLAAEERLGNKNVPERGRVCFCSYAFANLLKRDPAFMRYGDSSQKMLEKGVIGEVDGTKIVKVPAARLPSGCAFLLVHPSAATAPKQLEEYKIHDNPPGISGYLVEGRCIYDCFVLDEKASGIFYHGSQRLLKPIEVKTAPSGEANGAVVYINPNFTELETNKWYYQTAADAAQLGEVSFGQALSLGSAWTRIRYSGASISTESPDDSVIRVVEITKDNLPVAVGDAALKLTK